MYEWANDLTGEEEHERDMYRPGSTYEYCKHHPSELISDGMFDAPCGGCEAEMEDAAHAWEVDPANVTRKVCADERYLSPLPRSPVGCLDVEDEIPF
jgi:hypothetical protein